MASGRVTNKLADDVQIRVERGTRKLSPPTYVLEHITTDYAWVQMTCCIRECGEICGTHIPSPSDEYDECNYEVWISEDSVNWREVGLDIEGLTPNTTYTVRARTVDLPYHRCVASDWITKTFTTLSAETMQITATSPIPLCFTDDCEGGQRIPCSSNCVWGQDVGICDGRHTELACWDGTSTICSITPIKEEGITTKDISTCGQYDNRYKGTITSNPHNNTLHITITQYPPFTQEMPPTMRVTADSNIPLWVGDESGTAQVPCTRENAMKYGMGFHISATEDIDNDNSMIAAFHIDHAEGATVPFNRVLSSSATPLHLRGTYEGTAFIEGALGTVHINLEKFTPEPQLTVDITATSPIPLYYSDDSTGPQQIPCSSRVVWDQDNQICDARYTTEDCWNGTHVISSLTFQRGAGIVTRNLSEGSMYDSRYKGTVTANSHDNTLHIKITEYPPIVPQLTVDIPASVAAGGIPTSMQTLNDTPFTFIIRNNTDRREGVAVFLSFKGVGTGVEYPRDITSMETKPDGGQGPPGSDAYVWDDGYVSPLLLYIDANASSVYTLNVWLPDEAVPAGQEYANYTIHTVLKKY